MRANAPGGGRAPMMTEADLNPAFRDDPELIDNLWRARREGRRDLHAAVAALLGYEDPVVREDAVWLLCITWADGRYRDRLTALLGEDDDFGVRGRAAFALACVSGPETRGEDVAILSGMLRDPSEDRLARRAAHEGLLLLGGRRDFPARFDPDRDVDWDWVAGLTHP